MSMLDVLDGGHVGELNENQREYLQRVEKRARNLNEFIDELLSLAEAQGLRRPAAPQPVDLAELTEKVAGAFRDRHCISICFKKKD